MRIVFISDWFSEKMGYAEHCLPKAVASLGHEVHLITSNVQIYYNSPNYQTIYEPFIGPNIVHCETKKIDGYTLHRLPYGKFIGKLRIRGLRNLLIKLKPDVVQTFSVACLSTLEAAFTKFNMGYCLFLEAHVHASVFPLAFGQGDIREKIFWSIYSKTLGKIVNKLSNKCYPIADDVAMIAVRNFGISRNKIEIVPLGVDTELFFPPVNEESQFKRKMLRQSLGFAQNEIVCIYTGRFSSDKNPLCLAKAIGKLISEGHSYRGLFIGNGSAAEVDAIQNCDGNIILPFVPVSELAPYYWAADIGVWPKQESTSQLDAAACGLPLILSNRIKVLERIEGSGLLYEEDSSEDLANQLLCLESLKIRAKMGENGLKKILNNNSWNQIANKRLHDYEVALRENSKK